jgi:D-glycero-alpha-D-manno-heptose-7-phosphate kinase
MSTNDSEAHFDTERTLIICRTPYRISFFGGGTDYPEWYQREGGRVLSTTIDRYCFISARFLPPFFAGVRHKVVWRHVENVMNISEILHPAIRQGLEFLGFDDRSGVEIHHQGDLPARSGMGTSSAFAVGLIRTLTRLQGDDLTKYELALKAIELEKDILNECVGSQDQVAAAYGGLNSISFCQNGEIRVEPVEVEEDRLVALQANLILLHTGGERFASNIARDVIANLRPNVQVMRRMIELVQEGVDVISGEGDLDEFGSLLNETWILKRQQSQLVSSQLVEDIYETALRNGAIGGKLLGAGSSGFMLFYAPQVHHGEILSALSEFLHVPFQFETEGCTLLSDADALVA